MHAKEKVSPTGNFLILHPHIPVFAVTLSGTGCPCQKLPHPPSVSSRTLQPGSCVNSHIFQFEYPLSMGYHYH
jgi:hypothetical protein